MTYLQSTTVAYGRQRNLTKTDKHEVTFTRLVADESSPGANINILTAVQVADKDASTEVSVGSHVKWVFVELNFSAEGTAVTKTVQWTIRMVMPGQTASLPTQFYAIDRSYVLKRGMEMLVKDTSTLIKRVFVVKIPRIYQRMKEGQVLELEYISSSTNTQNTCGVFIYREQY